MEQWKKCKIRDIVEVNAAQYTSKDNWEKALYLDTGNITENKIDEMQEFDCSSLPSRARRKVKHGDIIFSTVRPNQKHYGYITNPVPNLLVSTGFAVISVNQELANSKFIYYWLSQDEIVEYLHNIAEQSVSAYPSIKASDICNLEIKLPPLEYQSKVASILSTLENKISLNHRINGNLEQQAQALFKAWFVDFEPFKDGKFVDSELGMIPEGWKVGNLSDIANITMGQSPDGKSYNECGDGMIFYQGRAEFGYRFPYVRLYTTQPKKIAEPLSILLSVRAPVGDINIAYYKCCIGRGLAAIQCTNKCQSFLFYLIQSLKPIFNQYNGEGTVFGSISKEALSNIRIVIPKIEVINRFESIAKNIDRLILQYFLQIKNLESLRDTLLPRLMSGELNVNTKTE